MSDLLKATVKSLRKMIAKRLLLVCNFKNPLGLFCLLLALASPLAKAATSGLNVFSDGEVIYAEQINENFRYVLESAASNSGCSAQQDGGSVVITCADGTSGVLASAGTVVAISNGVFGNSAGLVFNTGDIVVKDNDGVIIAVANSSGGEIVEVTLEEEPHLLGYLYNDDSTQQIRLTGTDYNYILFQSDNCSGQPFVSYLRGSEPILDNGIGNLFAKAPESTLERLLFGSRIRSAGMFFDEFWEAEQCEAGSYVADAYLGVEYFPSPEIVNATYPFFLEQLP